MSRYANIFWWIVYTALAIYFQTKAQGFDAFVPGIIIALQERKPTQTFWIISIFFLLQNGMGSMTFGKVFLWYFSVIITYLATRWFFEVESLLFILLLSFISSFNHYWIITVMAGLQDLYIDNQVIFEQNIYQAFLTPLIWSVAYFTRRGFRNA